MTYVLRFTASCSSFLTWKWLGTNRPLPLHKFLFCTGFIPYTKYPWLSLPNMNKVLSFQFAKETKECKFSGEVISVPVPCAHCWLHWTLYILSSICEHTCSYIDGDLSKSWDQVLLTLCSLHSPQLAEYFPMSWGTWWTSSESTS